MVIIVVLLALLLPVDCLGVTLCGVLWSQQGSMCWQKGLAPATKKIVELDSVGVLCQSNRAKNSELLDSLHFEKRRFTVLTAFSAFPFDWG